MHNNESILAVRKGRHVICEKPLGFNITELQNLRKEEKKAGVNLQSGLALRWNPFITNLKNLADRGELGDIFYMEADYYHELGPW